MLSRSVVGWHFAPYNSIIVPLHFLFHLFPQSILSSALFTIIVIRWELFSNMIYLFNYLWNYSLFIIFADSPLELIILYQDLMKNFLKVIKLRQVLNFCFQSQNCCHYPLKLFQRML